VQAALRRRELLALIAAGGACAGLRSSLAAGSTVGKVKATAGSTSPRAYLPSVPAIYPTPPPPGIGQFGYGMNLANVGVASVVKQLGFGYVKGYVQWFGIETSPGQYS